jgi:hypothetical protein
LTGSFKDLSKTLAGYLCVFKIEYLVSIEVRPFYQYKKTKTDFAKLDETAK